MPKIKLYITLLILLLKASLVSSQSNSIEIWIRSFIPDVVNAGAASHNILANPNGSGSLVEINFDEIPINHPFITIIKRLCLDAPNFDRLCFATDNRGFSSDPGTTARTDTKFTVTFNTNGTATVSPTSGRTTTGITKRLNCTTGATLEEKAGKIDLDAIGMPAVAGDVVQVIGQVTATDQLVPCAPVLLTPSADCSFDLKWNRSTTELTVDFTFGVFPAFEIYARQPGNQWIPVFQQLPLGTAWQLAGDGIGLNSVRKTVTVKVPGLSGKWQSTPEQRFTLELAGNKVKWTERSSTGATLMKEVPIRDNGNGNFRIERANDNEVLSFLGFDQQSLRNEILARGPQPSFIIFRKEGTTLKGEWNGLIATKLPNGHLNELIQPGIRPFKVFIFNQIQ